MLHKHIAKHVSRFHTHIQEHGHKRALIMIMSSMVMMFYPYFSTRADLLPSGGDITVQYSPDDTLDVNTDVVATVVHNSASGVTFAESDTYTFTENGQYTFEYYEDGVTGTITAEVDWIDKEAPTGTIVYNGDPATGPVTAILTTSELTIMTTTENSPAHVFTENGTFLFTFIDGAGNTGSVLAEVTSIGVGGICGNGNVEAGEQCDAGQDNGDGISGCSETCELETSGGGNGTGGTGSIPQDVCPNGDFSPSFYDGTCNYNTQQCNSTRQGVGSMGFSSGGAQYMSIVFDSSNVPYVAFQDALDGNKVSVRKFNGTTWEVVGNTGLSYGGGLYISLAIDENDIPYVAYTDFGTNGVAVQKFNGVSRQYVGNIVVSAGNSGYPSLAFDNNNIPYVAFMDELYNENKASVVKFTGTTWEPVGNLRFSEGVVAYTNLSFDNNNIPYVAFEDEFNGDKTSVMKLNGTTRESVGNIGFSSGSSALISIAFDNNNVPYVAFEDGSNGGGAGVMKFNGTAWQSVGLISYSAGYWGNRSLSFDENDSPYIIFNDGSNNRKASVKKFNGSTWEFVGNSGFSSGRLIHSSIAFDNNNIPYVAFGDLGNDEKISVMKLVDCNNISTGSLTSITGTVTYATGSSGQVLAIATGFNMAGVFAVNNSNSLSYVFTTPGSFTFALQTAGGNTGSVTATATTGMFTTGTTNTGTNTNTGTTNTGTTNTGTVNTGVVCGTGDVTLTGALGGVYSLTTPVVVGGLFSINWTAANNDCNPDQIVTIQLRDHNGQWITLGTGELDGTGVSFRSTGLAYTGLYSIFGTHASGSIYTYTGTSGQQLTGAYTVDTPYTIYTGAYTGAYTGLWTGYEVRILSASGVNLLSGARPFTIDNTIPSATGFTFIIGGANASGVVGSGGTFTLSFVGSELLSNIQLLVNNTLVKSWTGGSSTGYSFTGGFGATNLSGSIAYSVSFTDAGGNTGSVTGTNIYTIDTIDPNFQAFAVTGTAASGVKFSWNTSKNSVYNFQFSLSGSTGVVVPVTTNAYATSHNYTTTALATGKTYMFSIKINDALQNTNFMSGTVAVNASGAASVTIATQNNNVLQLSSQVEAKLFSQILKEEIKKFESCKSDLKFKSTSIELKGTKSINLKIPEMEKSSTKTIVQAFSLMLVNKLKTSNLSASELDETETKVNNFFVILKLLKDDKGDCKQNLSAYYINQFERIMEDMLK